MDLRPHIDKFARRFAEVETALSDPKAFDNPQRAQELSQGIRAAQGAGGGGAGVSENGGRPGGESRAARDGAGGIRNGANGQGRNRAARSAKRNGSRKKFNSAFCRRIRPIRAIRSWKFAREPAGRNPRCLPPIFTACTRVTPKRGVGRWKTMDSSPSDLGGFKEVIFQINGTDVYKRLKYESGVHRVQRVPATEAQGRIHTSTVHRGGAAGSRRRWISKSSPRIWKSTSAALPAKAARA